MPFRLLAAAAALFAALPAQDPITEEAVKATVSWLAADERMGRDSPSAGLEASAAWIADRFAKAGLAQVVKDSWFHVYDLPGVVLDSGAVRLHVVRKDKVKKDDKEVEVESKKDLVADTDVRLWRPGDTTAGDSEEVTVGVHGDPLVDELLRTAGGRRLVLLEVDTDNGLWATSGGAHGTLGAARRAARPVLLVRKGALPTGSSTEPAWSATWSVPATEKKPIELKNVVGVVRGRSKPDEYVLVSAHYDHIGVGRAVNGDMIHNGADDDATGTTAVVLLAEYFAHLPPEKRPARSLLFVCFSAEEKGLRGSQAFAEKPPVPLDKVVANVNIEMIGRPEPGKQKKAWITGSDLSDFADITTKAFATAGIEVVDFKMAAQLFAQSDNLSLARKGVVAHSISAGSLHADYHQVTDEVQKLDLPHMTAIVRGLREVVAAFGDVDKRPAYNEKGTKALERFQRR